MMLSEGIVESGIGGLSQQLGSKITGARVPVTL
jgi:hypothetical protein